MSTVVSDNRLTSNEFDQLSSLVYSQCGIKLTPAKKIMLESRLAKRLRVLGVSSFGEYIRYVKSSEGMALELVHMIDVVTTNKTDFFREPHHFDYLSQNILPQHIHEGRKTMKVWCAACSTGEEPYTLAMVLQNFAQENKNFDFDIFGSDISTNVLKKASLAIYSKNCLPQIPAPLHPRYLLKSKDVNNATIRIAPELRRKVQFGRINLMDAALPVHEKFDVIFLRNVLIYFDRQTQISVVRKLTEKLKPHGYLFIGHAESLFQADLPLQQIHPTIYKKK
jgi:chemotaxis protein methyltransferase CheR